MLSPHGSDSGLILKQDIKYVKVADNDAYVQKL